MSTATAAPVPVVAAVRTAPVPQLAPEELARFVEPTVVDGVLEGWRLVASSVWEHSAEARAAHRRFRQWRRSYETSYPLGDDAVVGRFLTFAAVAAEGAGVELSVLGSLSAAALASAGTEVGPAQCSRLVEEVASVQRLLSESALRGWGLVDPDRAGLVRADLAIDGGAVPAQVVLAERGDAAAVLTPESALVLRRPGGEAGGWREDEVGEYRLDRGGVSAWTTDGVALEQLGPHAEAVLSMLAPGSARWRCRQVPLTSVWAGAIVGLGEGAALAASSDAPLRLGPGLV